MAMTGEEIDQLAESVAVKLQQTVFRLAPWAKEMVEQSPGYLTVLPVGAGAFAGRIEARIETGGITLRLFSYDGSQVWQGTLTL